MYDGETLICEGSVDPNLVDTGIIDTYPVEYTYGDADGSGYLKVIYSVEEKPNDYGPRPDVPSSVDLNVYYASVGNKTGAELKNSLYTILRSYTMVSYGDARYILGTSDEHQTNPGYFYTIYDDPSDGYEVNVWDGTIVNREHVWPNSYLGVPSVSNSDKNIASDLHNLRICRQAINSTRSNRYFNNGTGSRRQTVGLYAFYPGDDHRGDVARIMFYMLVMYPELKLSNLESEILAGTSYTSSMVTMGLLDILIEWHSLDPVSDFEMKRNNVIYANQGNRNPFIDRPYYVERLFAVSVTKHSDTSYTVSIKTIYVYDPYLDRKQRYLN